MVGIANIAMLGALAALAVPVLLHLMKRQQPRTLVYPTLRFLRRSQLPKTGRRKLRDIPLLLIRMLLFALLALVFAHPFLRGDASPSPAGPSRGRTRVILLDVSASMAADTAIEQAQQAILRLLDQAPARDRFGLVASANGIVFEMAPEATSKALRTAVRSAEPRPLAGDPNPALERAAEMLAEADGDELVIVSDFQQSDWHRAAVRTLPPRTTVTLRPVSRPESANRSVESASIRSAGPERSVVRARIRSFANTAETVGVELRSDDRLLAASRVEVPARGVAAVELMTEHFPSPKAVVRIEPDSYAWDDSFHVWLGAAPPPKVLLVAPFADSPDVNTDAFFLRQALALAGAGGRQKIQLEDADAQFLFGLNPEAYTAIILVRAAGFLNDEAFEKLRQFAENGGGILVFPGNRAALGVRGLAKHGLLDAAYRGTAQPGSPAHPQQVHDGVLAAVFSDGQESDLFLAEFHKYVRIDPGPTAETLVSLDSGNPALVRQTLGKGCVFAFAAPTNPAWTDMPLRLSFVPLIHEVLDACIVDERRIARIACGERPPMPPSLTDEQGDAGEALPDTSAPGVVKYAGQPVLVNVSRSESLPTAASLAALRDRLGGGNSETQQTSDTTAYAGAAGTQPRFELWPWLAGGAAVLLLLELMIAQRTEQSGATPAPDNA